MLRHTANAAVIKCVTVIAKRSAAGAAVPQSRRRAGQDAVRGESALVIDYILLVVSFYKLRSTQLQVTLY